MDFVTLAEVQASRLHSAGALPVQLQPKVRVAPQARQASNGSTVAGLSAAGAVLLARQARKKIGARASPSEIAEAVSEGRMITLEEAAVRKAAAAFFLVLFLWQAFLVVSTGEATLSIAGSSYSTLALLSSNVVGFGGSGILSL